MRLRRVDVVDGALELLDQVGLDALTIRRLSAHLGVQPGALYWHFTDKRALLEAMADAIVGTAGWTPPDAGWDEQIRDLATQLRAALLRHRDGARLMAGTYVTEPNTTAMGLVAINVLCTAGLSIRDAAFALTMISQYVLGHTIEEQAFATLPPDEMAQKKRAAEGDPVATNVHAAFVADPDARFQFGIDTVIAGLRARFGG